MQAVPLSAGQIIQEYAPGPLAARTTSATGFVNGIGGWIALATLLSLPRLIPAEQR